MLRFGFDVGMDHTTHPSGIAETLMINLLKVHVWGGIIKQGRTVILFSLGIILNLIMNLYLYKEIHYI